MKMSSDFFLPKVLESPMKKLKKIVMGRHFLLDTEPLRYILCPNLYLNYHFIIPN